MSFFYVLTYFLFFQFQLHFIFQLQLTWRTLLGPCSDNSTPGWIHTTEWRHQHCNHLSLTTQQLGSTVIKNKSKIGTDMKTMHIFPALWNQSVFKSTRYNNVRTQTSIIECLYVYENCMRCATTERQNLQTAYCFATLHRKHRRCMLQFLKQIMSSQSTFV